MAIVDQLNCFFFNINSHFLLFDLQTINRSIDDDDDDDNNDKGRQHVNHHQCSAVLWCPLSLLNEPNNNVSDKGLKKK